MARIAAVLLAAGLSSRFGQADKLLAPLDGLALAQHAAGALTQLPLHARLVVTRDVGMDWPGFGIVANDRPEAGLSRSLALGVTAARALDAEAVLVALADMPFVPAAHFVALIGRFSGPASLVASMAGADPMPPALFGSDWFGELESLRGDRGARALLRNADLVRAPAQWLVDIDRPEDLAQARARQGGHGAAQP